MERTNSELKNEYLEERIYARKEKALLDLNLAVLMLATKRMQMVLKRELLAGSAA